MKIKTEEDSSIALKTGTRQRRAEKLPIALKNVCECVFWSSVLLGFTTGVLSSLSLSRKIAIGRGFTRRNVRIPPVRQRFGERRRIIGIGIIHIDGLKEFVTRCFTAGRGIRLFLLFWLARYCHRRRDTIIFSLIFGVNKITGLSVPTRT